MLQITASKKVFPLFNKTNWKKLSETTDNLPQDLPQPNDTNMQNAEKKEVMKAPQGRRNYATGEDAEKMKKALQFAKENPGKSLREVSSTFGVERKALSKRHNGELDVEAKVGPRPFLSQEEEDSLSKHLIDMASMGFGYDVIQVKTLVRLMLKKNEDEVTHAWFQYFMKRHPELARRRAQAFDKNRMAGSSAEGVKSYFELLQLAFKKCEELSFGEELTPNRIFVADEVGFDNNNSKLYTITRKGDKHPFAINVSNQIHITIMDFAGANGWAGPEFLLIPGIRQKPKFNAELSKYFPDSQVSMTPKGYMNEDSFLQWVNFFIEKIKGIRGNPEAWVLLVVDGHSSHVYAPEALKALNKNNILAISLPSHSTNLLQVHDVSIFHPLKAGFRSSIDSWTRRNGLNMKLEHFPEILSACWGNAHSSNNIRSGFRSTGLWPLNLNWLAENKRKLHFEEKSATEKFDIICKRHLLSSPNGFTDLVKQCDFLGIDMPDSLKKEKQEKNLIDSILTGISDRVEGHLQNLRKNHQQKKNKLNESHAAPKILNEAERIEKLEATKKIKVQKTKVTSIKDQLSASQSNNKKKKANQRSRKSKKNPVTEEEEEEELAEDPSYKPRSSNLRKA